MARTDADAEEDGTDDGTGRRRRYHHGNLREALVVMSRERVAGAAPAVIARGSNSGALAGVPKTSS